MRMVDLAGYVITVLIRPIGVLWDLDRGSEKTSAGFEHPLRQTMAGHVSMCQWSSYPTGREMAPLRNIEIQLRQHNCPECTCISQSSCFQQRN